MGLLSMRPLKENFHRLGIATALLANSIGQFYRLDNRPNKRRLPVREIPIREIIEWRMFLSENRYPHFGLKL